MSIATLGRATALLAPLAALLLAAPPAPAQQAPSQPPLQPPARQAPQPTPPQPFDLEPGTRVLAPIRVEQLALFPVVRDAPAAVDRTRYLTLAEGLRLHQVEVSERAGGGEVNRVTVDNRADRPLLLLGGEVILGGQQDRVLGKDTLVPTASRVDVEVFCVEHGRWSGRRGFHAAGGLAEGKIRVRAKFRSDQGEVWREVADKNAALGARSSTGTYRNLAAGVEGERAIRPYRDPVRRALARLPEAGRLVGVIAAINGRVTSVDVFARPELFAAYREALLDSIFVSVAGVAPVADAPAPSPAEIRGFVQRAEAAPPREVGRSSRGRTVEKRAPDVAGSTLEDRGAPVYRSYQSLE